MKRKGINTGKRLARINEMRRKHLWVADGECLMELRLGSDRPEILAAGDHEKNIDAIIKPRHTWQIIGLVFMIDSNGNEYQQAAYYEEFGTIAEVQPGANSAIDKMISAQNKNHIISWGWWATPAGDVDLQSVEDSVTAKFNSWGAWDKQHCEDTMLARRIKSNMEKDRVSEK